MTLSSSMHNYPNEISSVLNQSGGKVLIYIIFVKKLLDKECGIFCYWEVFLDKSHIKRFGADSYLGFNKSGIQVHTEYEVTLVAGFVKWLFLQFSDMIFWQKTNKYKFLTF